MTKTEILKELAMLRRYCETHDNPIIRADAVECADSIIKAITSMVIPEPVPGTDLGSDYATVRNTLKGERRMRMATFSSNLPMQIEKVAEIDSAGKALGRMAKALGLDVPAAIDRPEPQQAVLISVPSREVVA